MLNVPESGAPRAIVGAQMVSLTAAVLRALARRDRSGSRIVDLVADTGLPRPTVNRVVKALCIERLAMRLPGEKAFALGPLAFELGVSATRFPLREVASASMERISAETGDTCFLMLRAGEDAICVDRREGSFPVKALTIEVGDRRPLGAAAASLALLVDARPDELDDYLAGNADRIERYGMLTAGVVRDLVGRAKALGFALNNNNIIPEVSAVGVAIPNGTGTPYAALSVAALTSRIMREDRYLAIVELLRREAATIAARLSNRCEL